MKLFNKLVCRCRGHDWKLASANTQLSPIHLQVQECYVCFRCNKTTEFRKPRIYVLTEFGWRELPV